MSGDAPRRWSKRTTRTQKAFITALEHGATFRASSVAAGISHTTAYRWRTGDADFRRAVEMAEAKAELAYIEVIHEAAVSDWRAAAWWLERRRPDYYGRRERYQAGELLEVRRAARADGLDEGELLVEAEELLEHGWDASVGRALEDTPQDSSAQHHERRR